LTSEQVKKLLSLIEPTRAGYEKLSGNEAWIFDTGASQHMTGNMSFLSQVNNIDPILVELFDDVFRVAK